MSWQNGMQQQGNNWYGSHPQYSNYPPYGCPPGPGFVAGPPPPMPSQQGWAGYPSFPGYSFPPQNNWPYGMPPGQNAQGGNFGLPGANQTTEEKNNSTTDVTKINPPLPPDPPPGDPPKKEEKKSDKASKADSKKETKSESKQATTTSTPAKTESNPPPAPTNLNTPPPQHHYHFDPNQFTMPPPTSGFPMYRPNVWYNNPMFQNQNFNPMTPPPNVNNTTSEANSVGPVKFSLSNKKGGLVNNALMDSPGSQNEKKDASPQSQENPNYFPQNMPNNIGNASNSSNNNDKKQKGSKVDNFTKQSWVKSDNLCTSDLNKSSFTSNNSNFNVNKVDYKKTESNYRTVAPPPSQEKKPAKSGKPSSAIISSGDWPESLRVYVGKCFDRCVTELDKDQVEICLKGKLTQAAHSETLWTKDWSKEPLISIHSVAAVVEKKEPPSLNRVSKPSPKKFEGDPSRGFTIVRRSRSRSRSKSRSRSRSRSPSPFPSEGRRRREKYRHNSAASEERGGFLSLGGRQGRGGQGQRGRGKKKGKGKNNNNNFRDNENSHFYSKSGAGMTLDPEFSTDECLQKRAARFAGAKPQRGGRGGGNHGPPAKKKKMNLTMAINNTFTVDGDNIDWTSMHIVGTSTTLEKQYLRLTSAPEPSTIRTIPTLKKALEHVKKQWVKNHDYHYTCNQLKSIRQDLTVQGIRDEFTMQVYETHCRIALEKGDHEEFNQCQTQLKDLYSTIGGGNQLEFVAYRLLYYIFTRNTLDITSMMASLSEKDKEDPCVSFSLKLRAAWSLCNYHQFFKLYQNSPKMTGYLIDWFAKRERERAIKVIIKSYRPGNLSTDFVKATLALSGEDWVTFVEEFKICFTDSKKQVIDCKQTAASMVAS